MTDTKQAAKALREAIDQLEELENLEKAASELVKRARAEIGLYHANQEPDCCDKTALRISERIVAELERFTTKGQRGIKHSRQISGATLGAVLGVDGRTWRRYVGGDREMPTMARRLLSLVSGIDFETE